MEVEKPEKPASRERRSSRKADHVAGAAASEPRRGPKSCSSHYKGVTKHRRTGRSVQSPPNARVALTVRVPVASEHNITRAAGGRRTFGAVRSTRGPASRSTWAGL